MKNNCLSLIKKLGITVVFLGFLGGCNSGTHTDNAAVEEQEEVSTESDAAAEEVPSPPRTAAGQIGGVEVSIAYASPGVKGRTVWGDLVPFDEVWRTGANAATILEVSGDVQIQGETLPAGKYSLFTIPRENGTWTLILNKTWDQWGAYEYDEAQDALRVEAETIPLEESVERLRFEIDEAAGKIVFAWGELMLPIDIAGA